MGQIYKCNDIRIQLEKRGASQYTKTSYPQIYGLYSEIETKTIRMQFNLDGEITQLQGKGDHWPHPQEWLKRSKGNQWVYYSNGGYTGVFEAIGEYYLPNLLYETNSLFGGKTFEQGSVQNVMGGWFKIVQKVAAELEDPPEMVMSFIRRVLRNGPGALKRKSEDLCRLIGGQLMVLPPDTRHVDYDVLPLMIAEGCLYKCKFCKVKSKRAFMMKSHEEIDSQISGLREIYGESIANYNSVYLGEQDGLLAGEGNILYGIEQSMERLDLADSYMQGANFYLFASVDSLLEAPESLFRSLSTIPASIFINVGLESADQETLDLLGKPLDVEKVREAFYQAQMLNDMYPNIEVTTNFVMGELPSGHYPSILELVRESQSRTKVKGSVYISPLKFNNPGRENLLAFYRFKLLSRLPTFLYIIQRL